MTSRFSTLITIVAVVTAFAMPGQAKPPAMSLDLQGIQGLLAIERLDGWLLTDYRGSNAIARNLVQPRGAASRRWFYWIPVHGEPVALVPKIEAASFAHLPGRTMVYAGFREMDAALASLVRGTRKKKKRVAMEYSKAAALPDLSRVDAGTIEKVRALSVTIVSSADLVQAALARWTPAGRKSHYVAVHHLVAVRNEALSFLRTEVKAGNKVTEFDLQQRMVRGYRKRGLLGSPPIIAVNENAAMPHYSPTKQEHSPIRTGDLLLIDMWAKQDNVPGAIVADMTWMVYVGHSVPERYAQLFAVVTQARDATVAMIRERAKNYQAVRGFEADLVAREILDNAGHEDHFIHRTGHSIDTRVHGDGANLDDFETHDTRVLLLGTGFSVEPGIYIVGDVGLRSEINCFFGGDGIEVTTPVQKRITPLFAQP